jgi:hypothetical protein
MEFVALLRFRDTVSAADRDAGLARRASWQYPQGIKSIAEYWPMSGDVQVVSIFSAESFEPIMELELEWSDIFDISVSPAVSADEGLQVGGAVMGRLHRLQAQPM